MSKFVLQTFHVTDTFLQGVRQKSSIYPEDINLAKVQISYHMHSCSSIRYCAGSGGECVCEMH